MPLNRYAVQHGVARESMCDAAPHAVEYMMRELVRHMSPNWSTVRMEIVGSDNFTDSWTIRLSGEGITRPGGDRG